MLTDDEIFDITREKIVSSIINYVEKKKKERKKKKDKFQILDHIMPKENKILAYGGGLRTSLGTTLWETLATALAESNEFDIKAHKTILKPKKIPDKLERAFNTVHKDRENQNGSYDAITSKKYIKDTCQELINNPIKDWENPPSGHGVDMWFYKNNINYFFDTKTVGPNVGDYQRYLRQILKWYQYFFSKYPEEELEARIVFPYNPHDGNFWEHTNNKAKPLYPGDEAWVGNDFWSFCTDNQNAYNIILDCFKDVGEKELVTDALDELFNR